MSEAASGLCMGCMRAQEGQETCPHCGYDPAGGYDKDYIAPGTVLASRYLVGRLAHKNGEGARYLGYDNKARTTVWIREYFPRTIAQRDAGGGGVLALSGRGAQYKALMSDYTDIINEVKRLSITEPVVPVEDVVYENNTVYAVYKDLDLIPLEEWLEEQGGTVSLEQGLALFLPLLGTLNSMHSHGVLHRGISPYTVYVDPQGGLYLWDFALGGTRTGNSELESELFSGYSAPEQYSSSGWQGSWTDVYAAAALFYRMLSGVVPPKSTLVGPGRPVKPLEDLVMGLPPGISQAVGDAMRPLTEQRTQAVATFLSGLTQTPEASTAVYDTNKMPRDKDKQPPKDKEPGEGGSVRYVALALGLTALVLVAAIVIFMVVFYDGMLPQQSASQTSEESSQQEESGVDNTVPLFIGRMLESVENNPDYADRFEFRIQERANNEYEAGLILDQSPAQGTLMPEKGVVILHVCSGPELVEVPDLSNLSLAEAIDILYRLSPDLQHEVFERYDAAVRPGNVSSTVPAAGEEIDPTRNKIYLFVVPEQSVVETSPAPSQPSSRPEKPPDDDESSMISFWG